MSNSNKFRFSDRISLVTEHGNNVFINDKPLEKEAAVKEERNVQELQEQAYKQGWAACDAAKNQEVKKLQQRLVDWQQQLPAALNEYFAELETQLKDEIINLSFKLAEEIIDCEVANQTTYKNALNSILAQAVNTGNAQLYVNPEVAKAIQSGAVPLRTGISVSADPALKIGEVKLIGANGIIDGTFNARLGALKEHIQKIAMTSVAGNPEDEE